MLVDFAAKSVNLLKAAEVLQRGFITLLPPLSELISFISRLFSELTFLIMLTRPFILPPPSPPDAAMMAPSVVTFHISFTSFWSSSTALRPFHNDFPALVTSSLLNSSSLRDGLDESDCRTPLLFCFLIPPFNLFMNLPSLSFFFFFSSDSSIRTLTSSACLTSSSTVYLRPRGIILRASTSENMLSISLMQAKMTLVLPSLSSFFTSSPCSSSIGMSM